MTKTTNYQLNQWAKSDRIMMDDFNADNQKIDAALKANADAATYAPVLLRSTVLAEPAYEITLSTSGLDLSQFRRVELEIHLSAEARSSVFMLINGHTDNVYSTDTGSSGNATASPQIRLGESGKSGTYIRCELTALTDGRTAYCANGCCGGDGTVASFTTYHGLYLYALSDIQTFQVYQQTQSSSAYLYPAGSSIKLYGCR